VAARARPRTPSWRSAFETSRLLDYFSEKELTTQIGHTAQFWPVAILRELIDNALDACEGTGVPPEITVTTADDVLSVTDNGPGVRAETVEKSLDYMVRVMTRRTTSAPRAGSLARLEGDLRGSLCRRTVRQR
jgi:DNA gyrase/topoisomerase IV subunit B